MRAIPFRRDLSACCYPGGGAGGSQRPRAMRMLVAREDPDDGAGRDRLAPYPRYDLGFWPHP